MATNENATLGGDDRLKKDAAADARGSRSNADAERTDKDGTAFSKPERLSNFRDEWTANALPTPPAIEGYHLCWLSTTNSYDPIHKRMRMGYEPVKVEDVAGFDVYKVKSGEFTGFVQCNEMILFKIRKELYQDMMSYFHHEKPLEEEEMLKQNPALQDEQAQAVAEKENDGFRQLAQKKSAPVFN